jgi:hypothetical protein
MRRTIPMIAILALGACETTNSDQWTGGAGTPFKQAERSCGELTKSIREEADRRDFFIGCMGSLGWTPRPGAAIDL